MSQFLRSTDVAEAIVRILADPGAAGRTYELCGPAVYSLRELFEITLRIIGKRRLLVPISFALAEVQARLFELLPNPALTCGRVDLLKADNVASGTLPGLRELGIVPTAIDAILATYLGPSLAPDRELTGAAGATGLASTGA